MKRIDLHIHTLPSKLDEDFEFSLDVLRTYVQSNQLDAIAITNHNFFDRDNYELVKNELSEQTIVFPGVEVSVRSYHVVVIADPSSIESLVEAAEQLADISQDQDGISIERFQELFKARHFLCIPHFRKKPQIPDEDLRALNDMVVALEVSSPKKFFYEHPRNDKPVVLFSDLRCRQTKIPPAGKYSYVNIEDVSFESLRLSFQDREKFAISDRQNTFELAPGLYVAPGLNVVVGARSSGKTYFLDSVYGACDSDDVLYVRQFEIVKDAEEDTFKRKLADEEASFKADYYKAMSDASSYMLALPSREDTLGSIKRYIEDLAEYANSQSREDEFSKCPIYSEQKLPRIAAAKEKKTVEAILTLLDDNPLSGEIHEMIGVAVLVELLRIGIEKYKRQAIRAKSVDRANEIAQSLRTLLANRSARPQCPTSPFVEAMRRKAAVNRLGRLKDSVATEKVVKREKAGRFENRIVRHPHGDATKLKRTIGATSSLAGITRKSGADYVEDLLCAEGVNDLSKCLFELEASLKNDRNENVSGGQKAEFLFSRAIERAGMYDVVLIDEPESSFDNIYLDEKVTKRLKEISAKATVFISTHNNVLGVSIDPDGIVYIDYDNEQGHRVFSGSSTSDSLTSARGETVSRAEILLSLMEAGESAYQERKPYYGLA